MIIATYPLNWVRYGKYFTQGYIDLCRTKYFRLYLTLRGCPLKARLPMAVIKHMIMLVDKWKVERELAPINMVTQQRARLLYDFDGLDLKKIYGDKYEGTSLRSEWLLKNEATLTPGQRKVLEFRRKYKVAGFK